MTAAGCPTPDELRAFSKGDLAEHRIDTVAEHLEVCPHCEALLSNLGATVDTAVAAVRHAGATPACGGGERGAAPGGCVGEYEILEEIGRGGMGVVYKARQPRLNRVVALKLLLGGQHAGPEHRARFRAEAEAAARLQHPNVVQVFEAGDWAAPGGTVLPYLALEYVEGGPLAQLANRPQPPAQAAAWVETLARAVEAAHQAGVIHRDLKPSNVLVTAQGQMKVCDFGVAKLLGGTDGRTATGLLVGTPEYMAPEQAAGHAGKAGPAADVWALGAILYTLLTGRPPFQAPDALGVLRLLVNEPPPPPRRLQPKVPRDLETVCLKCLEKEPPKRYASARELADDLRRFLDGEPVRARRTPAWGRAVKWARRRPAIAGLLALLLALTAAAGGLLVWAAWEKERGDREAASTEQERRRADEQKQRADRAEELKLQEQAQKARQALLQRTVRYGRTLEDAQEIGEGQNFTRAVELLDSCPHDLRHWEWRYLRERYLGSRLTLVRGQPPLTGLAVSPDGRRLLTADSGGGLNVWDAVTGQPAFTASQPRSHYTAVAYRRDGKGFAAARADGKVEVWAEGKAEPERVWLAHRGAAAAVAFGPGDRLATCGEDRLVRVWDAASGKQVCQGVGHEYRATAVAFDGPGQRLVSVSYQDAAVRVWDAETGKPLTTLPNLVGAILYGVAFSPDGALVAAVGQPGASDREGVVRLWDVRGGKEERTVRQLPGWGWDVAFSPDGGELAVACNGGEVLRLDVATGKRRLVRTGHEGGVRRVAYLPSGDAVTAGLDGTVRRVRTVRVLEAVYQHQDGLLRATTVFDPDAGRLLLYQPEVGVVSWGLGNATAPRVVWRHPNRICVLAASADRRTLAALDERGAVRVMTPEGKELASFPGYAPGEGLPNPVLALRPDGKEVVTARDAQTLLVRTLPDGRVVRELRLEGTVQAAAYAPAGDRLAAVSVAGKLRVWDAATGAVLWSADEPAGSAVRSLAYDGSGGRLLTAGGDGTAQIRDAATGAVTRVLDGKAMLASFSVDGKRVVSAGLPGAKPVQVHDAETGVLLLRLREPGHPMSSASFSPDSRHLVVCGPLFPESPHWQTSLLEAPAD